LRWGIVIAQRDGFLYLPVKVGTTNLKRAGPKQVPDAPWDSCPPLSSWCNGLNESNRPAGRAKIDAAYLPRDMSRRFSHHLHDGGGQGDQGAHISGRPRHSGRTSPLGSTLDVSIGFYFKTKRRDLDNRNKVVLDALTGIAYDDDSQINALHLFRRYDPKRPRIEISVDAIA
jgi:hypothetical protein